MKIQLDTASLLKISADCMVIVTWDKTLSSAAKLVDQQINGALSRFIKETKHLETSGNNAFFTLREKELASRNLLLVNLGDRKKLKAESFRKAMEKIAATIETHRYKNVCFALDEMTLNDSDMSHAIRIVAIALQQAIYRFEHYKSQPKHNALEKITFLVTKTQEKSLKIAVQEARGTFIGMNFKMDLANTPPNICHPEYLAKEAVKLAKTYPSLTTKVIDDKALRKMGAGAIVAVGQGSKHKPKLIIVEHRGGPKSEQPYVLVGKGITFDTGGNNLKPFDGMLGMKYDMSGAATVLGVIKAVAEMKLKINVIGVLAAAENMPGPEAYRPEDIITSLSGQTIEVLNTDAEGRLVLCDALTYVERYKPKVVIDIATLTGAIITCLGDINSGLFSNNDALAKAIEQAGQSSLDGVWRLPISDAYDAMINSNFADIKNIGGPAAGSITAACFLARFTKKYPWAHLDIAGTASMKGGLNRRSTGRPVPLLIEYLLQACSKQ